MNAHDQAGRRRVDFGLALSTPKGLCRTTSRPPKRATFHMAVVNAKDVPSASVGVVRRKRPNTHGMLAFQVWWT